MKILIPAVLLLAAVIAFTMATPLSSANVFITPDGNPQGACTTNPQPPSFFNNAANWGTAAGQIGPGTTVHLCGSFSATIGTNILTARGSGASGSPVIILFENGAVMTSPAFGSGNTAAIVLNGQSFLTVDGGTNGIIQNTANGDTLGNTAFSTGISALPCNNCEIRNLTIRNIYVHLQNGKTAADGVDQTLERAIDFNGSNWSIHDNTMRDCGWCLFENYLNGDTNIQIFNNNISNFDHAWALSTDSSRSVTNVFFHDNQIHDAVNWDASGCPFHHDGIHTFGRTGSSMNGIFFYNNFFFGSWGTCVTGFIFVEGGSSTPSHMQNFAMWNNVGLMPSSPIVNTNSWWGIFSGESGTQQFYNNTFIGPNSTDNTACVSLQNLSTVVFQNNGISNCGNPLSISSSFVGPGNVDHNLYGPSCQNLSNCFELNGSFTGSFPAWKTACGCDPNSIQSNSPSLASDGSPLSGSPALLNGLNLTSKATGNLASLASDTSKGNTKTPIARPPGGNWTIGAYQVVAAPLPPGAPTATLR